MPYNPVSLANLQPFAKGENGGQSRIPRSAGASIREHWNRLSYLCDKGELTYDGIRTLAKKSPNPNERAAAIQMLRAAENPDPADFDGLVCGTKSLPEYAADGIDTSVIKKISQRVIPAKGGDGDEILERTIEFHDRAGSAIDRVINHTDGLPVARSVSVELGSRDIGPSGIDYSGLNDEQLEQLERIGDFLIARAGDGNRQLVDQNAATSPEGGE